MRFLYDGNPIIASPKVDYAATSYYATLPADNWETDMTQELSLPFIDSDKSKQLIKIIPDLSPDSSNEANFELYDLRCISQRAGYLRFKVSFMPTVDISFYIIVYQLTSAVGNIVTWRWWNPGMTAANLPEGFSVTSTTDPTNENWVPWRMYSDASDTFFFWTTNVTSTGVNLTMDKEITIKGFRLKDAYTHMAPGTVKFVGRISSGTLIELGELDIPNKSANAPRVWHRVMLDEPVSINQFKITANKADAGSNGITLGKVQFYRRFTKDD